MTYRLISGALLGALLIGCGGGGSGSSSSSESGALSSDPVSATLTQTLYHTPENSRGFIAMHSSMENVDYEIAGGADAALFTMDAVGVLAFVTFPDYENPTDSNGDGAYEVIIKLQADNGSTATQTDVTIVVDDVDDVDDVDEGGADVDGVSPEANVSDTITDPEWSSPPVVVIPIEPDPLDGPILSYGGEHFALPDGLESGDIFVGETRLKNNYKIIASTKAVTVHEHTTNNLNSGVDGRYLEVGATDGDSKALIAFDRAAIYAAFGGESAFNAIRESISSVSLYLWSEAGTQDNMVLSSLRNTFSEESVLWNTTLFEFNRLSSNMFYSDPSWQKVTIPKETLLFWMDNPAAISGVVLSPSDTTRNGEYVRFSSDETTRPPSLVVHYLDSVEASVPVINSLGLNFDNQACSVHFEVSPPNPSNGQNVQITATARDNSAVDYVAIKDHTEYVAYAQSSATQTNLSVTYNTIATLPSMSFAVKADDLSGMAPSCYQWFQIPVRGSGSAPEIIVEETPEIRSVSPKSYRFIKYDGQKIALSFKASDPDGITKVNVYIGGKLVKTFDYDGTQTAVNETVNWQNNYYGVTQYNYRIQAFDKEGRYSLKDSAEAFPIRDYPELALYNNALNFINDKTKHTLDYDPYMFYTYSELETKPRTLHAGAYAQYKLFIKKIARKGLCYGMSAASIELTKKLDLLPENLKATAMVPSDLTQEDPYVMKYLYTKQASQYSLEGLFGMYLDVLLRLGDAFYTDIGGGEYVLHQVINALNESPYNLGILSISEFDMSSRDENGHIHLPSVIKSHAVVPWMVRQVGESEWRIYVYDPNKPQGPRSLQAIQEGESMTFTNKTVFPYVTVNTDSDTWSYEMQNGETWNSVILYIPPHTVTGQRTSFNTIHESTNLYSSDYDLPNLEGIHHSLTGAFLNFINSEAVDLTITYDDAASAPKRAKGSDSVLPIPMSDADERTHLYMIQKNTKSTIVVTGKQNADYEMLFDLGRAKFSIEGKDITVGANETLVIDATHENDGYDITFTPTVVDSDFNITASFNYGKLQGGVIVPSTRVYTLNHFNLTAGSPIKLSLTDYSKVLKIESDNTDLSFNLKVEESVVGSETLQLVHSETVSVNANNPLNFNFSQFSKQ